MKHHIKTARLLLSLMITCMPVWAQKDIVNGVAWFDTDGNIINSHGSGIIHDKGRYWLFGEYKSDRSNAFPGFGCYSSDDLVNWRFERIVLPMQKDGLMGPNRVGERVKVMRCPSSGKYVMFMHSDNLGYNDPYTVIAVSDSVNGDYRLVGPLQYNGQPVRKWDIGVFQDDDGKGYLLVHHGPIYRLSKDYLSAESVMPNPPSQSGESPTMMKYRGIYYIMYSHLTSWERNDNFYYTSTSIEGPWTRQGLFCPEGTLTYNSQCSYILPVVHERDTTFMYMGDRWSYPHQATCATQVWLPLTVKADKLSIPEYWNVWNPNRWKKGVINGRKEGIPFVSNKKDDSYSFTAKGRQIVVYGHTDSNGGYGRITITDSKGKECLSTLIDFYSLVPDDGIRFVSPVLQKDEYMVTISVAGEQPVWYDKAKHRYGSHDYYIYFSHAKVR